MSFNSLTDSHNPAPFTYKVELTFNSLTDSHWIRTRKNRIDVYFQFPNGFSQEALTLDKKANEVNTFNSLTDSHRIDVYEVLEHSFTFQFPNGFSRSNESETRAGKRKNLSIP